MKSTASAITRNMLASAALLLSAQGLHAQFTPNVVVEEGTGEWCGYCPRGIVAIDEMKELHPDGTFIAIAVHQGDEFEVSDYVSHCNFKGYPDSNFNRWWVNQYVNLVQFKYNYRMLRYESVVGKIDLTAYTAASGDVLTVNTTSTFGGDKSADFRVAIVLTEDKVRGAYQRNYYYDGAKGEMGGFENRPEFIYNFEFNDVARLIYPRYEGENIASYVYNGLEVDKTFEIPIPSTIKNLDNVNVIALLLQDGKIINAVSEHIGEAPAPELQTQTITWNQQFDILNPGDTVELTATATSGLDVEYFVTLGGDYAMINGNVLEAIAESDIEVTAMQPGNGLFLAAEPVTKFIAIRQGVGIGSVHADEAAEIYSLDGRRMTSSRDALAPGIYIVRTADGKTAKIAIR